MKVAHLCQTLCHPMVYTVHGIFQATILENTKKLVTTPFFRGSFQPRSLALQADSLPAEPPGKPSVFGGKKELQIYSVFLKNLQI